MIAARLDPKRYAKLLSATLPAIIETEEQNEHYLGVVEGLMRKGENLAPEEEMLLNLLSLLISEFERRFYQIKKASPLDVLKELMAANELKQIDLVPIFGSKGITSEVLNGKRGISKEKAKALADYFHISAEAFI
jgi:HTH-type transcriptional regulator/antitoxin HigA